MKILDSVALKIGIPEQSLRPGQVGTIVEEWKPGVFEVEFSDLAGKTYAFAAVEEKDLLPLHHSREEAA